MKPLLFATLAFAGSLSIFPCRQTGELPDELAATAGTSDRIKMETFQTTSRTSQTPSKGQGQTTDDTSERHKMTSQEVLQEGKDIGEAASKITTQGRHVLNTYANPGHLYYKLTIPVADTATPVSSQRKSLASEHFFLPRKNMRCRCKRPASCGCVWCINFNKIVAPLASP